jgi:3-oxoacyl-[acyl-carrier protein] reductase
MKVFYGAITSSWKRSERLFQMDPKVALITGADRGIGRSTTVALAKHGWQVVINYHKDEAAAMVALHLVKGAGSQGLLVQADIALAEDRTRLVTQTLEHFGRINLLVNNAGIAPLKRVDLLETGEVSYDEVMAVNLKGPFFLTQRVATEMVRLIKSGIIHDAQIINIGSMSAYTSSTNRAEYCLSKAGLAMMTRLFADRLADEAINVYEIQPGIITTDMTIVAREKYDRLIAEGLTPIRRWGCRPGRVGHRRRFTAFLYWRGDPCGWRIPSQTAVGLHGL